jgi:hypothetical protein
VHDDILQRYPSARLKVLAVWFDMLPGDSRQFLDTRVLSDPRVTYFWDEGRVAGRWYSDNVTQNPGITWDHYFLYEPDARWPATPVSHDGPVIGSTAELQSALGPYLAG